MKIFCIQDSLAGVDFPVWYMLPDSAVLKEPNPFFIPDFDNRFSAHPVAVVRISRLGKSIAERFAHRYYEQIGLGCRITADSLLERLRSLGAPWEKGVSFDRSFWHGSLVDKHELLSCGDVQVAYGEDRWAVSLSGLEERIASAIVEVSRTSSLKMGDIIAVPLGEGSVTLVEDVVFEMGFEDKKLLTVRTR